MSTKAHLEEEVRELRAVMEAGGTAIHLAITHLEGSPAYSAEQIVEMLRVAENESTSVRRSWEREQTPTHAPAVAQKKPRTARAGTFQANAWHYTREDGLPISQSITDVCEACQCRVALLSARRVSGGFYDVRADFDGFQHDCKRSRAGKEGS